MQVSSHFEMSGSYVRILTSLSLYSVRDTNPRVIAFKSYKKEFS